MKTKYLALVLVLSMVLSLLPQTVRAVENEGTAEPAVTETQPASEEIAESSEETEPTESTEVEVPSESEETDYDSTGTGNDAENNDALDAELMATTIFEAVKEQGSFEYNAYLGDPLVIQDVPVWDTYYNGGAYRWYHDQEADACSIYYYGADGTGQLKASGIKSDKATEIQDVGKFNFDTSAGTISIQPLKPGTIKIHLTQIYRIMVPVDDNPRNDKIPTHVREWREVVNGKIVVTQYEEAFSDNEMTQSYVCTYTVHVHCDPCDMTLNPCCDDYTVSTKKVLFGKKYDDYGGLPALSRAGYVFLGWYPGQTSGNRLDSSDYISYYEDFTLYAQWGHTVTFDANGGDSVSYTQDIQDNVKTVLSANQFARERYLFTGWNTRPDGSGTSYADRETITISNHITLYAQWVPSVTMTFENDELDPMVVPVGGSYTLPTPTNGEKEFWGWYRGLDRFPSVGVIEEWEDLMLTSHWVVQSGKCGDNLTWTTDDHQVLTIRGQGPMYDYTIFDDANSSFTDAVIFPDKLAGDQPWSSYNNLSGINRITIEEGVTYIGEAAFCNFTGGTSHMEDVPDFPIVIPGSVKEIGAGAFFNSRVTSVVMEEGVETIRSAAFASGSSGYYMKSCVFPESVAIIQSHAFLRQKELKSVEIPGLRLLGPNAFEQCISLESVTIPYAALISDHAFLDCTSLTSIYLPILRYNLGEGAFQGCKNLEKAYIGGYVPEGEPLLAIGTGAFYNCDALRDVMIFDGIGAIGEYAFTNCANLDEVAISNSVTSIGNYAFGGSGLMGIYLPDSVTSIGKGIFNSSALTDVYCTQTSQSEWEQQVSVGGENELFLGANFHWSSPLTRTVRFEGNGGTGSMDAVTLPYMGKYTLSECGFTAPAGKQFKAWSIDGEEYAPGRTCTMYTDMTCTAVWEDTASKTCTLSFDANGGTGKMDAQTVSVEEATKLQANTFTRSGYNFTGWNTKADGSGTAYTDKASVTLTADLTLYAQWEKQTSASIQTVWEGEDGGAIKVSLTGDVPTGSNVFVAAYSTNGQMLGCNGTYVTGSTVTLTLDTSNAGYVRAFLLNTQNQPLCDGYQLDLR